MAKRLSMRKIAEVLRLHHECSSSQRDIALAVGVSPTTVGEYVRRAKSAGIGYPHAARSINDQPNPSLMGVQIVVESLSRSSWNHCPDPHGITVQILVESLSSCAWNTHDR